MNDKRKKNDGDKTRRKKTKTRSRQWQEQVNKKVTDVFSRSITDATFLTPNCVKLECSIAQCECLTLYLNGSNVIWTTLLILSSFVIWRLSYHTALCWLCSISCCSAGCLMCLSMDCQPVGWKTTLPVWAWVLETDEVTFRKWDKDSTVFSKSVYTVHGWWHQHYCSVNVLLSQNNNYTHVK